MSGFAFPEGRALDLLCLGRAGVDLYAMQPDTPLEHVSSFRKSVGGSPANIATAVAMLAGEPPTDLRKLLTCSSGVSGCRA